MVQSKSVLSVSTEMKVGNSGYENICIDLFGANVNEYFDHLIWHLADRKFSEKTGMKSGIGSEEEGVGCPNCYVELLLPTGLPADEVADFCRELDKYWDQKNSFMINCINLFSEA